MSDGSAWGLGILMAVRDWFTIGLQKRWKWGWFDDGDDEIEEMKKKKMMREREREKFHG